MFAVRFSLRAAIWSALVVGFFAQATSAQEEADNEIASRVALQEVSPTTDPPLRRLAPGVERTVDPAIQVEEQTSLHDLPDLLKVDPKFGERPWSSNLAKGVRYEHDIWNLEFSFKPLRFIDVDVPTLTGSFERKSVWYLIYRVRNTSDQPVRFVPRFLLHSWDTEKFYPDRLIPVAIRAIQRRERPPTQLVNSIEISDQELPPAVEGVDNSVWGVVTWEHIDQKTDRFSIYVQGLTNAYRWSDADEPRRYLRKTLQLNFWRPGDEREPKETEVRFGIPEDVDYRWVYK